MLWIFMWCRIIQSPGECVWVRRQGDRGEKLYPPQLYLSTSTELWAVLDAVVSIHRYRAVNCTGCSQTEQLLYRWWSCADWLPEFFEFWAISRNWQYKGALLTFEQWIVLKNASTLWNSYCSINVLMWGVFGIRRFIYNRSEIMCWFNFLSVVEWIVWKILAEIKWDDN